MDELFLKNRKEAGMLLADKIFGLNESFDIVIALPRGGVVVGKEVSKRLGIPLDFLVVKKIGHPYSSEYAIGSVTENGVYEINKQEAALLDKDWLECEISRKEKEARSRASRYLKIKKHLNLSNKSVILVDDGAATGLSLYNAIMDIKQKQPRIIMVAVPVASNEVESQLKKIVNNVVILVVPKYFLGAIGSYYEEFEQVSDEEAEKLLKA